MKLERSTSLFCLLILLMALLAVTGCGGENTDDGADQSADQDADSGPAVSEETTADSPRAFFASPEDGAAVGTTVTLTFGAENFTIEPVGDGMVHDGTGHYHVGLDTECLPAGEVIPTADPWIHFGDGSSEIEYSLPPGEHTLTLQIGDGEHRTLPEDGLCNTISVTASE